MTAPLPPTDPAHLRAQVVAQIDEIARLKEVNAALLAACEAVAARFDELYENMDPDHAAFFTAMTGVAEAARAAVAAAKETPTGKDRWHG